MIIDFHTHIFPEKIAAGTIKHLEDVGGIKAYTNGMLDGLKASMKDGDIDYSVVLPVVTKPGQFDSVNKYAREINGKDGIISFGGIHPDSENITEKLKLIKDYGLKGIKLHPDYQDTFIDDERYINIISKAADLGLIVVIHAGVDIGLPNPVHCPPKKALKMLNQVNNKNARIVLAHTGGYDCWDEVIEYLAGENVYLDISYTLHKMLFATDSPWGGQKETVKCFLNLPLSKKEQEDILYKNAFKLLEV